jgi:hypothetical protein
MATQEKTPVEQREEALAALLLLFSTAQKAIVSLIARYPIATINPRRMAAAMNALDATIYDLNQGIRDWAGREITPSYTGASAFARERAKDIGRNSALTRLDRIQQQAIDDIAQSVADDLGRAAGGMRSAVERYFRRGNAAERARAIQRRTLETGARGIPKSVDSALDEMLDDILEGRYVQAGSRKMEIEDYVETVARTRMQDAITDATIYTALGYGLDLVMVGIRAACPQICMPYIGRIYSISGKSTAFPRLDARPTFHPNCMCYLIPVSIDDLRKRLGKEGLKTLSEISKDPKRPIPDREFYERAVGAEHLRSADEELETVRKSREARKGKRL